MSYIMYLLIFNIILSYMTYLKIIEKACSYHIKLSNNGEMES